MAGDVLVTNRGDGTLSVVSPDNHVVETLYVGPKPTRVAVAPPGVPNAGSIYIIHAETNDATASITIVNQSGAVAGHLPGGRSPRAIAIAGPGTPHPGSIYVATSDATITIIPTNKGAERTIRLGRQAFALAIAPAGTPRPGRIYLCEIATNPDPSKARPFIGILDAEGAPVRQIPLTGVPIAVAVAGV
jgi:DNA-binding beta-propeller fold protein YncE